MSKIPCSIAYRAAVRRSSVGRAVLIVLVLCLAAAGCATETENRISSSGDPEADQRAEQRVGDENGDGKDGQAARTLYERLGGERGITAIIEDMTTRVIADPRVNFERKNVKINILGRKYKAWDPNPENIGRFKHHMIEFLSLAAGGPAQYTGRDMRELHHGMKITNNEFDALVGDLKTSMDTLGVPTREKRDVIAIFETTRKQIVEKQ